jgi:hypothetical protein
MMGNSNSNLNQQGSSNQGDSEDESHENRSAGLNEPAIPHDSSEGSEAGFGSGDEDDEAEEGEEDEEDEDEDEDENENENENEDDEDEDEAGDDEQEGESAGRVFMQRLIHSRSDQSNETSDVPPPANTANTATPVNAVDPEPEVEGPVITWTLPQIQLHLKQSAIIGTRLIFPLH